MIRRRAITAWLLLFLALALIGCSQGKAAKNDDTLQPKTDIIQDRDTIEAFGVVKTFEAENISIGFPAEVIKVYVKEGQSVKSGEPLMKIDFSEYDMKIEDLQGQYTLLKDTKNKTKAQKEEMASLERNLEMLKAKKTKPYLEGNKIISCVQEGVVFDLGHSTGDMLNGSEKALSIANTKKLYINANIPEDFIKDVNIGADVTIIPLADRAKEYEGKILRIADKAYNDTGETFVPIEISINDNDGFLKVDYNVDIAIDKSCP